MSSADFSARRSGGDAARSLAWLVVLAAVAWGATALGRGPLAPPPLTDIGAWGGWAGARRPVEAAFALLTLVVMALAWYLLAVTALATTGRLLRAGRLVRVADVLTLPLLRPAVHAALGITLVGATVAGVATAPASRSGIRPLGPADASLVAATGEAGSVRPVPVPAERLRTPTVDAPDSRLAMRLLPQEGSESAENQGSTSPPVMRLLPPGEVAPPPPAPSPVVRVADSAPAADAEWQVRPGDHLWSVAAGVLEEAWGTPATDDEVAPYWRRLVEANRAALADPANPDLLYPGQIVAVPAPPPTPR